MSDTVWFEEELMVPEALTGGMGKSAEQELLEALASALGLEKSALGKDALSTDTAAIFGKTLQGTIRLHIPRWQLLKAKEETSLAINSEPIAIGALARSSMFLVRLGVEFDLSTWRKWGENWKYTTVWHRVHLWADGDVQPRVVNLYPERLYEGKPHTVKVEAGPEIKAGPVELRMGKLSIDDIMIGEVSPVSLGFHGEEERNPYWELRPGPKRIEGIYHFWLLVEAPMGVPVNLAALVEANLQAYRWSMPVGPKKRVWEDRQKVVLQV